jgi:LuxR family maltose regulon positive regulatory protein
MEGHPIAAVYASIIAAASGRPAEAERWADAVDRWLYQDTSRPADPSAEALATVLRFTLCRDGVEQMRADADEAVHKFAAVGRTPASVPNAQGIARVLCGDLDGGDAFLEDAVRIGDRAAPDVLVRALAQSCGPC